MAALRIWKLVYSVKQILKFPELCHSRIDEYSRAKMLSENKLVIPVQSYYITYHQNPGLGGRTFLT